MESHDDARSLYRPPHVGRRGQKMSRLLILIGLLFIAAGLLWPWIGWVGHLPGDIVVKRENFSLYVPIVTGLVISVVITVLLWLIRW